MYVPQHTIVLALGGDIDLVADVLKVMLLQDTYVPNPDHKFVSSLTAHECNATGYSGGYGGASRRILASKTLTEDVANNRAVFDAADPAAWTLGGAVNNTLLYAAIIKEITNDAASQVVALLRFENGGTPNPVNTNGGDIAVQFNPLGILYSQS